MGPTASGKTSLAINLYQTNLIELISVDSVMIYKDCDIGSAKPSKDELIKAPHHLINKITVEEIYTASDFYHEAHEIIKAVHNRDRTPVFVGGTMMYFKSLLDGMDNLPPRNEEFREFLEERAKSKGLESLYKDLINKDSRYISSINQKDKKRIIRALEIIKFSKDDKDDQKKEKLNDRYNLFQYSLVDTSRKIIHQRIEERLENIITDEFIDEVKNLLGNYDIPKNHPILKSVNYKQCIEYLNGEINKENFYLKSLYATRQLAKKQATWINSWKSLELFELEEINKLEKTLKKVIHDFK